MSKIKYKIADIEKKQKIIANKLDKFDYNYNLEKEKIKDSKSPDYFTFKGKETNTCQNIINDLNENILDKDYKKVLDNRLEEVMGKINDNIINQNYINFYDFLLHGKSKFNYKDYKYRKKGDRLKALAPKKQKIEENIKIEHEIEKEKENEAQKKDEKFGTQKNENIIKEENYELRRINSLHQPKKIELTYYGGGRVNVEELSKQKNQELLHKKQNVFLGNELTKLKVELNKIRKDNEFLQTLIHEKGTVKNQNVLSKLIGNFVERMSMNWNDVSELIIDEMIIDEVHELNEIELKKNYEKNKNKLIDNLEPQKIVEMEDQTNGNLLLENLSMIKNLINSINTSEKQLRIKYNKKNNS